MKCCICGREFDGLGNNPEPVVQMKVEGVDYSSDEITMKDFNRCCDVCNAYVVAPVRAEIFRLRNWIRELDNTGYECRKIGLQNFIARPWPEPEEGAEE